ncbi:YdeI/OmpD-associated family protein [Dyadobacter pollutisoli]|uniref:YdeI/OmpD-associated family protein n=1 Tax=Dyadobacter pollutisoli TaxID=2910158 RepID=A0A9E8NCR0_9BACT|nr:YdeI/OmpD-associated family protein [Dyadobacter pollutisoli]WAC11967.1 YdeI/OmpD-associated family protein [Dyadobacter pollutisoli]
MNHTDPRIDTYILKSADFAIPILTYLREIVHTTCPEATETMKWSFPHFEYKGSILCSMASFKQHCAFGFWLGSKLTDPHNLLASGDEKTSMGQLGRITSLDDLPKENYLIGFIREAMQLIDSGVKQTKEPKPATNKELVVPEYFAEALQSNADALKTFTNFSYSQKKEYVEWITDAKSEATRDKRMETALEWLAEGKIRNWKYVR